MKNFTLCISLLLALGWTFNVQAQEMKKVPGDLLVQMVPGHTGDEVAEYLNSNYGPNVQARSLRLLSQHMNIYHLHFEEQALSMNAALDAAWSHPFVQVAQFNHEVEQRAVPNDANFNSQWQYINTGQTGGLVGADIDADLAWDITTGGVTALGDTIVVCIIDDGLDASHQDFGDNVWINHAEIPNNNIDDDGNGYVDDYRGWDVYNNNDNISNGGWHGTPVAGIVGAQGNNGIGVAGVNWDVKLMIVRGGTPESNAIASYAYALEARKRYNQTGGQEGAFVVSTNASWGIDYGQPSQAPLWCAMYDTLGAHGILSMGATANVNLNVDVDGDLPTACPSEYLISVTNMTDNDVKVNQAAYGATHVDLGAFGANAYTTANNNGYGGFGGTSGATPHVTGAAALLYSAPCVNYANLARTYPDSAARLARDWIFNGVDANTSLSGITTTGGRLNLHKALLQVDNWDCSGNGCFSAFALGVQGLVDTSGTLTWSGTTAADSFRVQFREQGAANWNEFFTTSTSEFLGNLQACTAYEFRVETICDTSIANFTPVYNFKTDGCCEAPLALSDSVIVTTAILSFDQVLAAQSYTLRYRPLGSGTWTTMANLAQTTVTLQSLDSCTTYEYQVQTVCDTGVTPFSPVQSFTTKGCLGCEQPYCDAYGDDNGSEWIQDITIASVYNNSGPGTGGYQDFTGQVSIPMAQGGTYQVALTPGYQTFNFNEVFQIFLDVDGDGTFSGPNELLYTSPGVTNTVTGNITVPVTSTVGITRLRVTMRFDDPADACAPGFDFGEVEDYCVDIKPMGWVGVDRNLENSLVVYPNPFSTELNVEIGLEYSATVSVRLFDITGKQVKSVNFEELAAGTQRLPLNTADLGDGMYFLDLQIGNEHARRKLTLLK